MVSITKLRTVFLGVLFVASASGFYFIGQSKGGPKRRVLNVFPRSDTSKVLYRNSSDNDKNNRQVVVKTDKGTKEDTVLFFKPGTKWRQSADGSHFTPIGKPDSVITLKRTSVIDTEFVDTVSIGQMKTKAGMSEAKEAVDVKVYRHNVYEKKKIQYTDTIRVTTLAIEALAKK